MNYRHEDAELRRIDEDAAHVPRRYSRELVALFRRRMQLIRAAADERDFYALKSLHYEKLKGREPERSIRLDKQYRLILKIDEAKPGNIVVILGIEDYH